jgi:hypothetical protein
MQLVQLVSSLCDMRQYYWSLDHLCIAELVSACAMNSSLHRNATLTYCVLYTLYTILYLLYYTKLNFTLLYYTYTILYYTMHTHCRAQRCPALQAAAAAGLTAAWTSQEEQVALEAMTG